MPHGVALKGRRRRPLARLPGEAVREASSTGCRPGAGGAPDQDQEAEAGADAVLCRPVRDR
eukprot:868679-Lingulodinium_polyedra.AAC.1